jgi:hypothetical protein
MDLNSAYSQAGITGSIIAMMGIAYRIYRGVNGKRCRCKICGYDLEADFKVDDMPPSPNTFTNPMVDGSVCPKPTTQIGSLGSDSK